MAFDDMSYPELRLGLSLHDQSSTNGMKTHDHRQRQKSKCNKAYPSLTLGPPKDDEASNQLATKTEPDEYFHPRASSPSTVSSFSNASSNTKRERDQSEGEEFELEVDKIPSTEVDVDENGNPRKKLRLTKQQSTVLEDSFKEHSTLNPVS